MTPQMLAAQITGNGIIVICTVVIAVAALAGFLNSALKDREGARAKQGAERARADVASAQQIEELRAEVTQFRIAVVGQPADPAHGLPEVHGFIGTQLEHNRYVDTELRTENGGGTIKGSLGQLRAQVGEQLTELNEKVDGLTETVRMVAQAVENGGGEGATT